MSLAARFATVLDAGRRIASALERSAILAALVEGADELLRGERTLILAAERDDAGVRVVLAGTPLAPPCEVLVGRALDGAAVSYAEGDRDYEAEALLVAGVRSAHCVPIVVRGEARALLYTTHRGVAGMFGDEERRLAEFLATLGGAAWENADGFEKLAKLTETLERRVQQRTAALEASNLELQQFAYVASHDLQAPLRGIAGFAQLLEAQYSDVLDEDGRSYVQEVVQGSLRMRELITDLLRYSRVDSGGRVFEQVDLDAVLDGALQMLDAEMVAVGAKVTRGDLGVVYGDPAQLGQLLQNLVGNGIKYRGQAPPVVRVWTERSTHSWSLFVRDNGIGIAARHQDRIFEIFKRLHTQSEYPGTGIGLAVCRRIVQRHGGSLTVDSTPGEGSTFRAEMSIPSNTGTDSSGTQET